MKTSSANAISTWKTTIHVPNQRRQVTVVTETGTNTLHQKVTCLANRRRNINTRVTSVSDPPAWTTDVRSAKREWLDRELRTMGEYTLKREQVPRRVSVLDVWASKRTSTLAVCFLAKTIRDKGRRRKGKLQRYAGEPAGVSRARRFGRTDFVYLIFPIFGG